VCSDADRGGSDAVANREHVMISFGWRCGSTREEFSKGARCPLLTAANKSANAAAHRRSRRSHLRGSAR